MYIYNYKLNLDCKQKETTKFKIEKLSVTTSFNSKIPNIRANNKSDLK